MSAQESASNRRSLKRLLVVSIIVATGLSIFYLDTIWRSVEALRECSAKPNLANNASAIEMVRSHLSESRSHFVQALPWQVDLFNQNDFSRSRGGWRVIDDPNLPFVGARVVTYTELSLRGTPVHQYEASCQVLRCGIVQECMTIGPVQ